MPTKPRHPALFVGHGSPMNAIEENAFSSCWRQLGKELPVPRAILCVSAHWETSGTKVTSVAQPRTIHDFYAFPPVLYEQRYPAPGSPELAAQVVALLGADNVALDAEWGLDHGTWAVLCHLYPQANIPVIQLSLDRGKSAAGHYALAQRLAPLREDGVLIIGSGNLVHNLGRLRWDADATPYPWATEFDRRAAELISAGDHAALIDYPSLGEAARLAIPTNEHYLPLLYTLAQQQPGEAATFFAAEIVLASISMRGVRIG
ncbi:MAG: 4,5-DOPA dioxygenase extradiol [Desulfuromonadales bacterium GWD2_61_12]|nr:MAG: 4,5-DOPA dioxygenase extradiol [Desulfuromonadales bacterium GWD2_61_12]OGR33798.1 MAG: 4,5-DOPA dioxygenase extradiol [Desulfuromonadales bacterium GWC2_61_20]HAD05407.1 4,5-DOPA dioxygenase extradiol [Desulfuromonas sp.]HBT83087.1 4,5-DOPA dioxygenase extradiol [Desulfuromonas sp.]